MKKFAIILSGCGVYDGAEIHEATFTMYAIAKQGTSKAERSAASAEVKEEVKTKEKSVEYWENKAKEDQEKLTKNKQAPSIGFVFKTFSTLQAIINK
mgnify:CR=1 FL=1